MKRALVILTAMVASGIMAFADELPAVAEVSENASSSNVVDKRFAWGIGAGSSIDMTGNDMSSLDINAYVGYSGPYVRFAGIGAGIDMMVSSSSNVYPVYALFRTDFRPVPQLYFLELRGGVAFSNIESFPMQTTPCGSVGFGVTLAKGRTFSSHIILSYNYTKLDDVVLPDDQGTVRIHDLQYASIGIGVTF